MKMFNIISAAVILISGMAFATSDLINQPVTKVIYSCGSLSGERIPLLAIAQTIKGKDAAGNLITSMSVQVTYPMPSGSRYQPLVKTRQMIEMAEYKSADYIVTIGGVAGRRFVYISQKSNPSRSASCH